MSTLSVRNFWNEKFLSKVINCRKSASKVDQCSEWTIMLGSSKIMANLMLHSKYSQTKHKDIYIVQKKNKLILLKICFCSEQVKLGTFRSEFGRKCVSFRPLLQISLLEVFCMTLINTIKKSCSFSKLHHVEIITFIQVIIIIQEIQQAMKNFGS